MLEDDLVALGRAVAGPLEALVEVGPGVAAVAVGGAAASVQGHVPGDAARPGRGQPRVALHPAATQGVEREEPERAGGGALVGEEALAVLIRSDVNRIKVSNLIDLSTSTGMDCSSSLSEVKTLGTTLTLYS